MRKLIRFLRGTVIFSVVGRFPERFMNLCATRGYALWGSKKTGEGYEFHTWATLYPKLRHCAKKSKVKMRVQKRMGLPFLLGRHKKRWGVLIGAFFCVVALLLSNVFLWDISVEGLVTLEEREVLEQLENLGVYVGAVRSGVEVRSVERRLMMHFEQIGWVAVNIRGTQVDVKVQERVMPPERLDSDTPCNVVAGSSGQIVSMQVYVGQTMVAQGDAVAKGDVLVSGVVEDKNRDMHLVAARATVIARTERELEVQVPIEQTTTEYRGVLRRYSIYFGNTELPLWIGRPPQGNFKLERMETPFVILGQTLPIGIVTRQYILTEQIPITLSPMQAERDAENKMAVLAEELLGEATILSSHEEAELENGVYTMRIMYELEENIALQQEIFTE